MTDKTLAWHFCRDDMHLSYGDDRLIVEGETLSVTGSPALCRHGLHGSERVLDALNYAPGLVACRIEIWGDVKRGIDKLVGTHRKTLYAINVKSIILEFARWCALQAIDKWEAPPVVVEFLNGNDSLARAADAAADAAYAAYAARAAYATYAVYAARAAADAARAAARAAYATYAAADAARAAADAAADAARAAAYASADAADAAAYASAYAAQNEKLTAMIGQAVNLQL